MDEVRLIKKIKFFLLSELYYNAKIWSVDEILTLSAVYILSFKDSLKLNEDIMTIKQNGTLKPILDSLKQCRIVYNSKKQYKRDDLEKFINFYWISSLSPVEKQTLLCESITIVKSISDEGYVDLKYNETAILKIIELYNVNVDISFGTETFDVPEDVPEEVQVNPVTIAPRNSDVTHLAESQTQLDEFWKSFSEKYDVKRLYDANRLPFVWELKISYSDYMKLKELLKTSYEQFPPTRRKSHFLEKYAVHMFVYVAEWYRREYDGASLNAFQSLSDTCNMSAKDIWETTGFADSSTLVYQSENENVWLHSLYVLGGLPFKYTNNDIDRFYDNLIERFYNQNDRSYDNPIDVFTDDADKISDDITINNTAFKKSLESGSLYYFVRQILEHDSESGLLPIAKEDLHREDTQNFLRRIREGRERKLGKKFRLRWYLYYSEMSDSLYRKLRVSLNPEELGRLHRYIKKERLRDWGIDYVDNITDFELCMYFNDDIDCQHRLFRFSIDASGEGFVAWGTEDWVEIPEVPPCYINSVNISIKYKPAGNREHSKTIWSSSESNYIQFYPTGNYLEWSSYHSSKSSVSAILFEPTVYKIKGRDSESVQFTEKSGGDVFGWYIFTGQCVLEHLVERNSSVILYGNNEKLTLDIVKPYCECAKHAPLPVRHYIDEQEQDVEDENISILFSKKNLRIFFSQNDEDRRTIDWKRDRECEILFKGAQDASFRDLKNDPPQHSQWIRLQVKYKKSSVIKDVFYCCGTVCRDIESNKIVFNGFSDGDVKCLDSHFSKPNINVNEFSERTEDVLENKSYCCRFKIGSEDDYIDFSVYRPSTLKFLKFDDQIIKVKKPEDGFDVCMLFYDQLNITELNENGVCQVQDNNLGFDKFSNSEWRTPNGVNSNGNKYVLYHCEDTSHQNVSIKNGIPVSPEFHDQYVFYYWSMQLNEDPYPIPMVYDECNEILTLRSSDFSKRGIVFQSLKGDKKPPRYWAPALNGIGNYPTTSSSDEQKKLVKKCIWVSCEHKIYCRIFPRLRDLLSMDSDTEFIDLFCEYVKARQYSLTEAEFRTFNRLAEEFVLDWLFLTRSLWLSRRNHDPKLQSVITELFLSNPKVRRKSIRERCYHKKIINFYWKQWKTEDQWELLRGSKAIRINDAVRYFRRPIRSKSDSYAYLIGAVNDNIERNKTFLDWLYDVRNSSFEEIYTLINEKLIQR